MADLLAATQGKAPTDPQGEAPTDPQGETPTDPQGVSLVATQGKAPTVDPKAFMQKISKKFMSIKDNKWEEILSYLHLYIVWYSDRHLPCRVHAPNLLNFLEGMAEIMDTVGISADFIHNKKEDGTSSFQIEFPECPGMMFELVVNPAWDRPQFMLVSRNGEILLNAVVSHKQVICNIVGDKTFIFYFHAATYDYIRKLFKADTRKLPAFTVVNSRLFTDGRMENGKGIKIPPRSQVAFSVKDGLHFLSGSEIISYVDFADFTSDMWQLLLQCIVKWTVELKTTLLEIEESLGRKNARHADVVKNIGKCTDKLVEVSKELEENEGKQKILLTQSKIKSGDINPLKTEKKALEERHRKLKEEEEKLESLRKNTEESIMSQKSEKERIKEFVVL